MGLAAHSETVTNLAKEISSTHLNSVNKVLHDAKVNKKPVAILIDDYYNIHNHHRPSSDTQRKVIHKATLLIKVFETNAIPQVEDSVNDQVQANIELLGPFLSNKMKHLSKTYVDKMPESLQTKFFNRNHRDIVI